MFSTPVEPSCGRPDASWTVPGLRAYEFSFISCMHDTGWSGQLGPKGLTIGKRLSLNPPIAIVTLSTVDNSGQPAAQVLLDDRDEGLDMGGLVVQK